MRKKFSIPSSRQLLYLLILALIPSFCVGVHFFSKQNKYAALTARLEESTFLFFEKEKKEATNKAVKKHFSDAAAAASIEKQLATSILLKKESETIERALKKNNFVGNPFLEERLAFLQGGENRLVFQGEPLLSPAHIQDTLLTLKKPAEVDMGDVSQILKLIENSQALFFVVDMQLQKKSTSYLLHLKLLKREIL